MNRDTKSDFRTIVTELEGLSPTPSVHDGLDDGRFAMIVLDTSAKIVSEYNHCAICAFNPDCTYTARMLGYTHEATLRKHLIAHLMIMFCGREELEYVN